MFVEKMEICRVRQRRFVKKIYSSLPNGRIGLVVVTDVTKG